MWRSYKAFVTTTLQVPINHQVRDLEYWQKKIFTTGVLYAIPLSILTLIASVSIETRSGSWLIPGFEIISTIAFATIAVGPGLSLNMRKSLVAAIVAFVAVALAIFFGEFSVCCIYLLSLSVFVALVYSNRTAYLMVAFNALVLIGFALAIRYHLFNMHLVMDTTFDRWLVYSLNFLLMNIIVVGLVRQIINGLVRTTAAIQQQNEKLKEIAYIQSHVIRLPLTRIMSISELINLEYKGHVDPELLNYLNVSTSELDAVIRDVVSRSEEVLSHKLENE
jgi:signal transduction histidine kinase